jgi:hypothetical protein
MHQGVNMAKFGERRLVRDNSGLAERTLFRLVGVPDLRTTSTTDT